MARHPKTHINQINKDQTQRTNIKSSKGKTTNNTQRDSHSITADLSIETLQARRERKDILKVMKGNNLEPRLLLEKAMAPHSSILAWKTAWMEKPGRLQSMESLRV